MSNKIARDKIQTIIQLYFLGISVGLTSGMIRISRNTIRKYIEIFKHQSLCVEDINDLEDNKFEKIFGKGSSK